MLRTQFEYKTPKKENLIRDEFQGLTSIVYYLRILSLISHYNMISRLKLFNRIRWANGSLRMIKIVESIGGRIEISGLRETARQARPVVYIANHMSMVDTLLLPCIVLTFGDATFVIKESLLNYPIFGQIMKAVQPIVVSRRDPRKDLATVLNHGYNNISRGKSVVIFPQATRSHVFNPATFNSMGVKLAKKCGVPVVPVALKTDFQGNGKIVKEIGAVDAGKTIYIRFGDPMDVEGNGQKTHKAVVHFITEHLKSWNAQTR